MIHVSFTLPGGARDNVAYSNAACIGENIALGAVGLGILTYLGRYPGAQQ